MTEIEENQAIQSLLAKLQTNPLVDVVSIGANPTNRVFYVHTRVRPPKGSVPRAWSSYSVEYVTISESRPAEAVAKTEEPV